MMNTASPALTQKLVWVLMSATLVLAATFLASAPSADAYQGATPCPGFSIQDVFDDPSSDWDNDRVNNVDELYNGLNPCIVDTAAFCGTGGNALCRYATYVYTNYESPCQKAVNTNPYGDYDGDGFSNYYEVRNYADPCSKPCPHPTNADLALDPNSDWDGDGVSNALEVNQGSDPCTGYGYIQNPCPYWNTYDVQVMPHHDWDGDGYTNAQELRLGHSPCTANIVVHVPYHSTYVTAHRLPHVSQYNVVATTPVTPICPVGYPYYHTLNNLCYANPVGRYGIH